ncbi:MAG: hypothetical protein IT384_15360 [Deltaproteobacteria bacterium]|nr:hypothetical protein [Deltaproteobacteria bacterium]
MSDKMMIPNPSVYPSIDFARASRKAWKKEPGSKERVALLDKSFIEEQRKIAYTQLIGGGQDLATANASVEVVNGVGPALTKKLVGRGIDQVRDLARTKAFFGIEPGLDQDERALLTLRQNQLEKLLIGGLPPL